MISIDQQISIYSTLSATEQAQVREAVFRELTVIDDHIRRLLTQAVAQYTTKFIPLEDFVAANAADFTAAERTDAVSARARIRGRFAAAANAVPGVSGATVA